jgi:hypothetical protein
MMQKKGAFGNIIPKNRQNILPCINIIYVWVKILHKKLKADLDER